MNKKNTSLENLYKIIALGSFAYVAYYLFIYKDEFLSGFLSAFWGNVIQRYFLAVTVKNENCFMLSVF